ncbi:tumor necrosis factor receptor superfamily member 6 [Takifugu flavidus]|uniref:tumor necrosis factor receptor superfamily member 6 n=1 Tax=Takifugu flavidus TaxID=433684 RepID=UPI0025440D89|nr:tumor necrosis factor receptor superfamily member 6 [Takifugu flavidus]
MEAGSNVSSGWIKTLILCYVAVSLGFVVPSSSQCVDGTYKHDGRDCCLCAAGLYLMEHCTETLQYGKCETCKDDTYSSEPTSQMSCEPCRSCSQPNDNLEEDEPCTPARNRKCRCRKDHYCSSKLEICRLCNPCSICEPEGIKVACTANNDTVCNERAPDGLSVGVILGIVFGVIGPVIGLLIVVACWHKRRKQQSEDITTIREMEPLKEVELYPHLPDIADIIGWKDMKDIAIASGITQVTIESVQLNHQNDHEEQTQELLNRFREKHGQEAAKKLIELLKTKGKNNKAVRVESLLRRAAGNVV